MRLLSSCIFLFLCVGTQTAGQGATINTVSCSQSDVQSAVNSASRGDTVMVPVGTCIWSGSLSLTRGVALIGAGRGNTILKRAGVIIDISPDATAVLNDEVIRVEGFTFDGDNSAVNLVTVHGTGASASKPFKNLVIGNNTFQNSGTGTSGNGAIVSGGQVRGVIFNNIFDRCNVILKLMGNDDLTEWSNGHFPFAYGNSDNLFFENNIIQYSSSFSGQDPGWTETGQGSRLVERYNSWDMANTTQTELWDIHGFQNWPGGQTGTMISEYYGNAITNAKGYRWIFHRGSWGLFFNNIVTGTGGMGIEAGVYSCTSDVPGASGVYKAEVNNTYVFNNTNNGTVENMGTGGGCGVNENDEFYNYNPSFNGVTGIGRGTTAPTGACTTGTAYWVAGTPTPTINSSVVQSGALYKCTTTNTWTRYYQPYTYPHPLRSSGGTTLYGDVSENGSVTAYDASLAAQYAVGLITLTSAQVIKADVSGNASVTSYDASLIAQFAVGLITKFPVEG